MIWGAIIGDIVGSRFEFHNIKTKDFDLFTKDCFFTDDTVMTIAVAKAIQRNGCKVKGLEKMTKIWLKIMGNAYKNAGYGAMFNWWLVSASSKPYNSFGNGSAMRISMCGYVGKDLKETLKFTDAVTKVTHDHPEGLKGARAVATAIFMARNGYSKELIKEYIEDNYYKLDFTLDEIRPSYKFNETCQDTVPQAIRCFYEAKNFEDTIRNAISIGGDSDTLCAIACSIAEAYWGVPEYMKQIATTYLDKDLNVLVQEIEDEQIT